MVSTYVPHFDKHSPFGMPLDLVPKLFLMDDLRTSSVSGINSNSCGRRVVGRD